MHLNETELNDYVDGALDTAAAQRVREHLSACALCAGQAGQIAALKTELAALPRDIKPARDLRSGIWRQVDAGESRGRTLWSLRYRLATAAVLLIVASSAVTLMIVRARTGGDFTESQQQNVQLVGLDSRSLERRYSEELSELEMILKKSRGALAPETVRILEHNLKIIDDAIREAKTALAADPQSDMLVDLLRSAYERKLELLRQAAKSSPVT